jgi:hypothetical protein
MFWTLLPFGIVVILIVGMLLAGSVLGSMPGVPGPGGAGAKGVCLVEKTKEHGLFQGKRFAIVDESTPIRFLSREEFELMKTCESNFIEMRAGDIVYLTRLPQ